MDRRCSPLGPLCCGSLLFALLILGSTVVFQTHAVDVEVKDADNITCLIAKWSMNFSVSYETQTNDYKYGYFEFPHNLTYHGSTCGNKTHGPVLAIQFGHGNSWTITFSKAKDSYQGNIAFVYNTEDVNLFPDAKRKGTFTIFASYPESPIPVNAIFSCQSASSVEADHVVQTFWDVMMQAYGDNSALGEMISQCREDKAAALSPITVGTTIVAVSPTPLNPALTVANPCDACQGGRVATNETTANVTTAAPTTAPHPLPTVAPGAKPATGNYSLKKDEKTTCFLANMGLQLNISRERQSPLIMNIDPVTTVTSGSCKEKRATLHLNDANITMLDFLFAVTETGSKKFFLKEVNVTVMDHLNKTNLHADNSSMNNWKAFMGSSYMCQRERTLVLRQGFSINTFDVWVQPFMVKNNAFATAEECLLDDDTIIIPIAVGAALGALIVLIVIAYLIGRRKSQVGYQTL
ncbi:hypothetical protein lerEdw1_014494 [Lerista edwardsae]|nr:hypothetical protein lerEdw1_014498 [Lerista edwardsae]KAJ6633518.1 hypothetical protein lerEdw1_014494 [Lerista edwardsae]